MSTDSSQNMNFNPSWMQPAAPLKSERPNGFLNRSATEDAEASQEMMDPVFANHRYGREDILALMGKDSTKPPDGLEKCPFFLEKAQTPIILLSFNENETRLQQNINSSKALSALNRQDRHHMVNGSEAGSPSSNPVNNSGWVVAGSNRGGGGTTVAHSHKPSPNRWSALAPSANPKASNDASYTSAEPYFAKRSMPGNTNNSSSSGGSTYNKPGAPRTNNSEHRGITSSRFRMPSTSKDQTPPLNENVAKLLESQQSAAPSTSSSTSKIWAKIGISTKDPEESGKLNEPDIGKEAKEKDWSKCSTPTSQHQHREVFDGNEGAPKIENHAKSASPPSNVPAYTGGFGRRNMAKPEMTLGDLEAGLDFEAGYNKPYSATPNTTPMEQPSIPAVAPSPPKPQASPLALDPDSNKWYYLDPSGIQRGPFEMAQMQAWYDNKYFDESLRLRRVSDVDYVTLGDLFHINGKISPFTYKLEPSNANQHSPARTLDAAASSIWASMGVRGKTISSSASNILPDFSLSDVTGGGMRSGSAGLNNQQQLDIENERKMLLFKELRIQEEEKRLREKEEAMRREEIEKERRIHEMSIELRRKEEELRRIEIEKERDFENKRLQAAEFERQKREALERIEEKIRKEHLQQLRLKEEENRRRAQEIEERQRQIYEAEARKRKEEEEGRIRLAYEEARRLQEMAQKAAKKAEEEQRQRLLEEQQNRMSREAEETKAREEAERKRKKQEQAELKKLQEEQRKQEALRIQQQEMEEELNRAVIEALLNESNPISVEKAAPTPWVTVGTAKPAAKKGSSSKNGAEKQPQVPQKSLLEIQEEEEKRAMQQKVLKQQELLETHRKNAQIAQQQQASAQKSAWGSPAQVFPSTVESPIVQTATKKKGGASSSTPQSSSGSRSWNAVPVAEPAPIPKTKSQQQVQPKAQKVKQKTDIKLVIDSPKKSDAFTAWIMKRVRELNSSVDAEVFASFIEGVDSPNEAEDYIIGYLGESKVVKEFHREFLQKRIELRPRVMRTSKDDLSGPAAAFSSSTGSNGSNIGGQASHSSSANNTNSHGSNAAGSGAGDGAGKKKKKGGKGKLVLDAATLGFRPAGDPNRVNAGEIDTAAPVPARKNR